MNAPPAPARPQAAPETPPETPRKNPLAPDEKNGRTPLVGLWRSLVSASVWGAEGREFESRQPDQFAPARVSPAGAGRVRSGPGDAMVLDGMELKEASR